MARSRRLTRVLEGQLAVDGTSGNGHYNKNAEVYMNVGDAMGHAMVELLKKKSNTGPT